MNQLALAVLAAIVTVAFIAVCCMYGLMRLFSASTCPQEKPADLKCGVTPAPAPNKSRANRKVSNEVIRRQSINMDQRLERVLKMAADGFFNCEIAEALDVSDLVVYRVRTRCRTGTSCNIGRLEERIAKWRQSYPQLAAQLDSHGSGVKLTRRLKKKAKR